MAVDEEYLKKVLDEIRPNLQADGGDLEYVGVDEDGVVSLELQGACAGCPMSQLTPVSYTHLDVYKRQSSHRAQRDSLVSFDIRQ